MAVRIAQAGLNEWGGTHGGQAGNQTRTPGMLDGELNVVDWYSKPWTYCIRPKDPNKAEIIANTAFECVKNANIGYDQNERRTLYYEMEANDWDASKVGPCETDCCAMWDVCANAAGIPIDMATYTGTMMQAARNSGEFDILTDSKYLDSPKYLKRGDGLVKPYSHAVVVLNDGSGDEPEPPTPPIPYDPLPGYDKIYQATDNVWLRTGPDTSYSKIIVINRGEQVYVGNIENGWGQVQFGTNVGYSSMKYYRYVEYVEHKKDVPSTCITTEQMWLRQGPGTNSQKILVIPKGTILTCSGGVKNIDGRDWYEVAYNTYIGWCSTKYLKEVDEDKPKEIKLVTTANLNMRTQATTNSLVIQVVPANREVISNGEYITNETTKWYYCEYNGKKGYMSSKYLRQA